LCGVNRPVDILFVYLSFIFHSYQLSFTSSAKPEFVDPLPSTHTVPKGTPVLMTCTVRGTPAPTVTWFRHDKALTHEDTDVTIEREGNECTLSIGQCEVQDEGSYSCMIQNEFGQATSNTKLDVQGVQVKLT
jgi:hypothetical protein